LQVQSPEFKHKSHKNKRIGQSQLSSLLKKWTIG
jgi:hypothetical protein